MVASSAIRQDCHVARFRTAHYEGGRPQCCSTRSGGVWTQQGNKLVGTGAVGPNPPSQAYSVALSGDGNTAIVGGPTGNSEVY
jgi:hypothetical protein